MRHCNKVMMCEIGTVRFLVSRCRRMMWEAALSIAWYDAGMAKKCNQEQSLCLALEHIPAMMSRR